MNLSLFSCLILLATSLLGGAAYAETVRQGGNEQAALVARMQQMVNDVTAERDALAAQNARLTEELATAKKAHDKELAQAEKKLGGSETALERYKQSDAALRELIAEDRARMQELVDKFRETAQNLRQVETERSALGAELDARRQEFRQCTAENLKLYQASLDLLDQYEHKGVWAAMMQREPATGLKRVEIENRVEEYRRKLDQMQVVGAE